MYLRGRCCPYMTEITQPRNSNSAVTFLTYSSGAGGQAGARSPVWQGRQIGHPARAISLGEVPLSPIFALRLPPILNAHLPPWTKRPGGIFFAGEPLALSRADFYVRRKKSTKCRFSKIPKTTQKARCHGALCDLGEGFVTSYVKRLTSVLSPGATSRIIDRSRRLRNRPPVARLPRTPDTPFGTVLDSWTRSSQADAIDASNYPMDGAAGFPFKNSIRSGDKARVLSSTNPFRCYQLAPARWEARDGQWHVSNVKNLIDRAFL